MWLLAAIVVVLAAMAVPLAVMVRGGVGSAEVNPLNAAWERASAAGSYEFRSELEQTTNPSASVANVGRGAKVEQFHIEGVVGVADSQVELGVWAGGGSVVADQPDAEIRIDDKGSYQRSPGGEWEESPDAASVMAPAGDVMAYLGAARDVAEIGRATVAGRSVTKYSFTLDGSVFATMMAEQAEDLMRARGELQPGQRVNPSPFHRDTVGAGELWVGPDGLPVRQVVSLRFPEQVDVSISAIITVDFFTFGSGSGSAWWFGGRDTWLPWSSLALLCAAVLASALWLVDRRGLPRRPIAALAALAVFVPDRKSVV